MFVSTGKVNYRNKPFVIKTFSILWFPRLKHMLLACPRPSSLLAAVCSDAIEMGCAVVDILNWMKAGIQVFSTSGKTGVCDSMNRAIRYKVPVKNYAKKVGGDISATLAKDLQHIIEFMRPVDLPNRLPFSAIP
jgi:hypothetical protein